MLFSLEFKLIIFSVGKENYVGVTEHWKMIAKHRTKLFQVSVSNEEDHITKFFQ